MKTPSMIRKSKIEKQVRRTYTPPPPYMQNERAANSSHPRPYGDLVPSPLLQR